VGRPCNRTWPSACSVASMNISTGNGLRQANYLESERPEAPKVARFDQILQAAIAGWSRQWLVRQYGQLRATYALSHEADIPQEWLGHANVCTTRLYGAARPDPRTAHVSRNIKFSPALTDVAFNGFGNAQATGVGASSDAGTGWIAHLWRSANRPDKGLSQP